MSNLNVFETNVANYVEKVQMLDAIRLYRLNFDVSLQEAHKAVIDIHRKIYG